MRPHPTYEALGGARMEQAAAYRAFCDGAANEAELASIRAHITQERAFGSERFQAEIEATLSRCARVRPPGRPVKQTE